MKIRPTVTRAYQTIGSEPRRLSGFQYKMVGLCRVLGKKAWWTGSGKYAGTFIVTVAGWLLWCIFTRDSFVPTVEVVALFIGALAFDLWRNSRPFE